MEKEKANDEDTPANLVPKNAQQLCSRGQSEPSNAAAVAMGSNAVKVTAEHVGVDPGDIQYEANADVTLSTVAADILNDCPIEDSFRPDLNQYQTIRSTSKPARKMHLEDNVEEDPMTEPALSVDGRQHQIKAFAKLQFEDGEFYMNTWSVELGRDIRYAQKVFRERLAAHNLTGRVKRKRKNRSLDSDGESPIKRKLKRDYSRSHPSSVFSEGGGVIAVDPSDDEPSAGFDTKKAASTSSSSQQMSRKSSLLYEFQPPQYDYQRRAMASLSHDRYDPLNPPIPAYEDCPLIPIHPPVRKLNQPNTVGEASEEGSVGNHNAISRRHVRIEYNWTKRLFELIVIGQNGAYLDDEFCCAGDRRDLKGGSNLLIGSVSIKFLLPNNDDDHKVAEILDDYDRYMDSESAQPNSANRSEGEENDHDLISRNGEDSDSEKASQGRYPEQKPRPRAQGKSNIKAEFRMRGSFTGKEVPKIESQDTVPKRKGPGRPPKNGVMSKREMGLLAKKAKEAAKAAAELKTTGEVPRKGEGGKVSDEKLQKGTTTQPNGKRKYTKRKNKTDALQDLHDIRESTENTEPVAPVQIDPPKPPKEKKTVRQPRSPSPYVDKSTLTEEQLAKPPQSYVVLIHEALTESKTGTLSLTQIYRAIQHKYPYYKYVVATIGWQSSVRHNLLQHEAFEKKERDGKGFMWGLKPGVSIEKEKKRRQTPPQTQPHYYHPSNSMPNQHGFYPGIPPQHNGLPPYHIHYPQQPANMQSGMSHAYSAYGPTFYPPQPRPSGIPVPLITPTADKPSTYQSPYAADSQQPDGQQQSQQSGPNSQNTNPAHSPYTSIEVPKEQSVPNSQPQQPHSGPSPLQLPPQMTPEERQAVNCFRETLLPQIPDKSYGELLVVSAARRIYGLQQFSSLKGRGRGIAEDPQELAIIEALRKVVKGAPKREAQVEQLSGAGRLTPGTIARGLVGEDGPIGKSVEADTKDEQNALAALAVRPATEVKSTESGIGMQDVARPSPSEGATQDEVELRAPEETLAVENHDGAQPARARVAVN